MSFNPSHKFRRKYDHLFKEKPEAANMLLLLVELADECGNVHLGPLPEIELQQLFNARFENPKSYQLTRCKK